MARGTCAFGRYVGATLAKADGEFLDRIMHAEDLAKWQRKEFLQKPMNLLYL